MIRRLEASEVRPETPTEAFDFETTASLETLRDGIGQARAARALRFGLGMRGEGYNLFVLGSPGTDRRRLVDAMIEEAAGACAPPSDWCYVNDFDRRGRAHVIRLGQGAGRRLRQDADELIDDLRSVIPAVFQEDEFRSRIGQLNAAFERRQKDELQGLQSRAQEHGLTLLQTPQGFAFAPVRDGKVLDNEAFQTLEEDERDRIGRDIETMTAELVERMQQLPARQQELVRTQKALVREFVESAVGRVVGSLQERWQATADVHAWLEQVQQDVVDHAQTILGLEQQESGGGPGTPTGRFPAPNPESFYNRYRVNLLVDNAEVREVPRVYESHPTLENLVGRMELRSESGGFVTDFTLIRSGALHRANGGFLVLDAERLLTRPFAWDALKRALFDGEVRLENAGEYVGAGRPVTLEPESVPLDVKVVLVGERMTYYLLSAHDPDFQQLFKVPADFADEVDRSPENMHRYARLLATLGQREGLRPLHRDAVGRVLDHGARLAADADKLSAHTRRIADLVREADHVAALDGAEVIRREHVQTAVEQHIDRLDRIRSDVHERITRGTVLIDTDGTAVGQVNGLSVLRIGDFLFGQPSRITASARLGRGDVVDIEREARLGGNIHSKAVMILTAFIGQRFAAAAPLSLTASLVFEQSYGGIEGDSATVAEVCALLSALARVPLRQDVALTGSMNQHGKVQAIGGANEKIEGFHDICRARGLTGEQGVLVPAANVHNLMLRPDVTEAVAAGRFHVWAMEEVDDALTLLSGLEAGRLGDDGWTPDSFNNRVQEAVDALAAAVRRSARPARPGGSSGSNDAPEAPPEGPPPGPEDNP